MPVKDYLIAVYFIVAFMIVLTIIIGAGLAIFAWLQRRQIQELRSQIAANEIKLAEQGKQIQKLFASLLSDPEEKHHEKLEKSLPD